MSNNMSKALFITEKPSVAMEFAKALNIKGIRKGGYIESDKAIITWCVGHLVNMSYPEKYHESYKKWNLKDLPFLPEEYKYEIIENVRNQFNVIKEQVTKDDISTIYVCTDSGREGEYIYRLVDDMIGVKNKTKKRVWIDSQTEDEIRRGVKEAKPLSEYDRLSDSAYLRAKEDYLIGINFSRLLTLIYGRTISNYLGNDYTVIAVGRVMSCVLGMIVQREREIREFIKTPYYRILSSFKFEDSLDYDGEWKAVEGSNYYLSKLLFKDIGFKRKEDAEKFIEELKKGNDEGIAIIKDIEKKKEKKNPPLLYNLAELQNECSKKFKISPDETLKVAQTLYEKKMLTYPRTDARVLSKAVAKEINKNIKGLLNIDNACNLDRKNQDIKRFVENILLKELFKGLEKTKYVNDKAITDHYAIIPTGQGLENFNKLKANEKEIFLLIVRRFLSIFYPPAIFNKLSITTEIKAESFFTSSKVCIEKGYLEILNHDKEEQSSKIENIETLKKLKKGQKVKINDIQIKESETTPPKRYNSGSMILAMENAGRLIEDEELREQIKANGIGTSATRAEILNKLQKIKYTNLNKKTQIVSPTSMGEMIYDVINHSIPSLLKPELTASWEKGLTMVSNGKIDDNEYMKKLEAYIRKNTQKVLGLNNNINLLNLFSKIPNNESKTNNSKKKKKSQIKNSLGVCTNCKTGEVLENTKAFYCTNWREGCKFTIWKNSLEKYGIEVTSEMIKELLKNNEIKSIDINLKNSEEKARKTMYLKMNINGFIEVKN
ncbi:DNA topoisomerase 3 [Gottschalkia acidurici 9a]|uniref:DNA topoisomerase n=1 Tax=Gottschalkia acidurici (strain ATCC 7906 / DSM 604 / BCRC 14475 / CIP 104303 / KCTC 5404 / NCIMB 10678 / 9a) TaxID=1128398 RepID=K0B0G9_GOTA9|nr:DNA topoisomerase [Gottschalkia acidurici]AFS78146.1 DNA topoisomerase 3 [Gottschalkia acidurici 9a]